MNARFGEFVFDSSTRELLAGGEPRHLSKRAFALLELLISSAPRALTKEEMYRHLWGDTIVEEVNLANVISEVRAALGETRGKARFIKTIHGYGYAFAGEIAVDSPPNARKRRQHLYSLYWRPEEFALHDGVNIIGRGEDADIVIDSVSISRRHARITITRTGATIEDLGSKNGTMVGGERAEGAVRLKDRDEIKLGFVSVIFRAMSRAGTTATEHASAEQVEKK